MSDTDFANMSDEDLLRASIAEERDAWNEHSDFILGQLYTGTVLGRPDLERVWAEEMAPPQARLDLHLTEGSISGHTAPADKFAALVAGVAEATKSISRKRLDRKVYHSPVLVRGVGEGSVRVVLEVQRHEDDERPDSMGELSTVDSESLRQVAAILAQADDMSDDSTLPAQIRPLSGSARKALRKAANQIAKQHWHVAGRIEQRGFTASDIAISPAGAKRLSVELTNESLDPKPVTLYGQVEGTIDIEGIVWFKPEGSSRLRAIAVHQDVAQEALALQQGHPRCRAEFTVYESLSSSNDVLRRSWELHSVRPAPRPTHGQQSTIDDHMS
ncbi:hypothetical protein SEA_HOLLIDAY_52 [Gordonia phage Holliday]|nr:hypothetical protein SEA_HOLLIDAY_52 [Gordonia phage Holliday]